MMSIPSLMHEEDNGSPLEEDELPKLPRELWREIGRRNRSRLDVSRFRSVCREWRSSLPPPIRFPLQIPPPPSNFVLRKDVCCFISEVTFYAAAANQSSPTMIVAFEEEYRGGKFSASTFLHKKQVHHTKLALPPVTKLSTLSFLCNAYHIHNAIPKKKKRDAGKYEFYCSCAVLKMEIISSDCSTFNPNYARLCDLKVVAHLYNRKLAVLNLAGGAMNNNWDTDFASNSTFEDIINHKGQLYAVNKLGEAFIMDYSSLQITRVAHALPDFHPDKIPGGKTKVLHLSEVEDNLYVFGHDPRTLSDSDSKLYRLSLPSLGWVQVELPEHVFVTDTRCNFAVKRDLIRRHTPNSNNTGLLNVPRFCSWPDFNYVRIAVGFNNKYDPPKSRRSCDLVELPYKFGFILWGGVNR